MRGPAQPHRPAPRQRSSGGNRVWSVTAWSCRCCRAATIIPSNRETLHVLRPRAEDAYLLPLLQQPMKRKAPDAARGAPLDADVSALITAVLRRCRAWRDACGRAFKVERRIERHSDRLVVRVSRFDRLRCTDLLGSLALAAAGSTHAVCGLQAAMDSGEVHFSIKRISAAPRSPSAPPQSAPPFKGDLLDVHACDRTACAEAAGSLFAVHGADALSGIKVRRRAAWYEVVAGGLAHVSDAACVAVARWPTSYIDFDRREHVILVDRLHPEL